uniref:Nicastrin n=1 Tax=Fagus sylvatica TaxID=28930 RepID=A0A2N9EUC2_FAGSY
MPPPCPSLTSSIPAHSYFPRPEEGYPSPPVPSRPAPVSLRAPMNPPGPSSLASPVICFKINQTSGCAESVDHLLLLCLLAKEMWDSFLSLFGLSWVMPRQVIEIGSIGKGLNQGVNEFYAHTAGATSATNDTLDALKRAQDSLKSEHIISSTANASNPGIPPSSLMAFLRKNSLTSGVVLEDFNSVFSNKFYHSHLDDMSNINSSAIVAAASLVARTLYILASDNKNLSSSALTAINVNVSLVQALMGCLLDCDPGLSCELVKNYISPTNTCPSHYVGVIQDEPSSTPYLGYVDDVSRFLWNFLADRTSVPRENSSSTCAKGCRNKGEVCVRAETDGKGVCVISTTRYVPAYSTRLKFDSGDWIVLPPNSSDPMGMVDPVWTESNWNAIGLRVYEVQNATYDRLVLLGGIALTVLAYLAIVLTQAFITKALKRD